MDGWEITRLRRLIELSQEDLAYLLGISACTVLRYERERARPEGFVLELLQTLDLVAKEQSHAQRIRTQVRARAARMVILYYILDSVYGARCQGRSVITHG